MIGRVFVSIDPVVRESPDPQSWQVSIAWSRAGTTDLIGIMGDDSILTATHYKSVEQASQAASVLLRYLQEELQKEGGAK